MSGINTTFLVLMLPFAAAILSPLLVKRLGNNASWLLALAPVLMFLHFASFLPEVAKSNTITGGFDWIPSFGVRFSWLIDGLSLTFALLISGIGALIVLYAGGYLKGHPQQGRFLSFILLFMGAMQGLVVSDSFMMLFVYWELTSITSFLLIGFDHTRERARRAAIQALVVTGAGGLALLAGLLLIWNVTQTNELSALLETGSTLATSPFFFAAFLLVLAGAFTKSAQFPLHFWLPNAMEAPTPVSAYLHSATMVKAGVYLLMRFNPVMGETEIWQTILPLFGGTTLLVGTFLAVRQTDLKLMLAYTTVASLGILVMLTGFGSEKAVEAAVLYLIAHSLFKGALFMVAGLVDHEAGTRDVTRLGGLRKAMPITFAAALLAAMSMGGLPLFFGFLAKEEIYLALWQPGSWPVFLTLVAIIGNALMFVIGFAVALKPFWGEPVKTPKAAHEGPLLMWLGPVTLAVLALVMALASGLSHKYLSSPMASAVAGAKVKVYISTVPHWGAPLLLSCLTIALGVFAFWQVDRLRALFASILNAIGWGPDRGFDQFISGLVRISAFFTRLVQSGRLESYVTATFVLLALCLFVPLFLFDEAPAWPSFPQLLYYEWLIIAIAVIGLFAVVWAADRLIAIVSLGIQGFAVALLFMLLGAPDLSFTQFMVETLSVVILALVMTRLRLSPSDHRPAAERVFDLSLASLCGIGFSLILLKITQLPFNSALSEFFAENSRVIAHGRNIVNVIIVDFRGVDTLGEIAVVMAAGLAILALIRIRYIQAPVDNIPEETEERA